MSMMNEIERLMNSVDLSLDYRIVNIGGKYLYIEGIKSILNFGVDSMDFKLKNAVICVKGSDLKVKYLDKTSCVLTGNINLVETK